MPSGSLHRFRVGTFGPAADHDAELGTRKALSFTGKFAPSESHHDTRAHLKVYSIGKIDSGPGIRLGDPRQRPGLYQQLDSKPTRLVPTAFGPEHKQPLAVLVLFPSVLQIVGSEWHDASALARKPRLTRRTVTVKAEDLEST